MVSKMTTMEENANIFDDETSQEDTGSKTIDSSESNDSGIEDDIEMSANQDDNPTTTITTNKSNHATSVIIDNTIYKCIHRDYFVDPKTQEINTTRRNKNIEKWNKLKKKVSEEIMDYLKTCTIAQAQKQKKQVRKNNKMGDVCRWSDIGTSSKQYSLVEIARKMNIITKT